MKEACFLLDKGAHMAVGFYFPGHVVEPEALSGVSLHGSEMLRDSAQAW